MIIDVEKKLVYLSKNDQGDRFVDNLKMQQENSQPLASQRPVI